MNKKGFTLIELLVVVLIIGILSSVALPQYTKAVEKSRVAGMWAIMASVRKAAAVAVMEKNTEARLLEMQDLDVEVTCERFSNNGLRSVCMVKCPSSKWYSCSMELDGTPDNIKVYSLFFNGNTEQSYKLRLDNTGRSCAGSTAACSSIGMSTVNSNAFSYY